MKAGARGQAMALVRRIEGAPDPLALYRALSDGGTKPLTLLFETADAAESEPSRSMVVAGAALSATCRGPRVDLCAYSVNGEAALAHVVERVLLRSAEGARVAERSARKATLLFPERTGEPDLRARLKALSPLDALRAMGSFEVLERSTPHAVFCAGVFAYDFIDAFEELPRPARDLLGYPDFSFLLADALVTIEPSSGRTTLSCTAFGSDDEARSFAVYNDASERLAELLRATRAVAEGADVASARGSGTSAGVASAGVASAGVAGAGGVDLDDEGYARKVSELKAHIAKGDVFQIVPSRTFFEPCSAPMEAYEELRARSPSPYMFYLAGEDHTLFGASPETSVRVTRGGARRGPLQMEIRPIAGTRRRGRTAGGELDGDLDNRQEAELLLDEKERAEHMMLVDLARNDVARACLPGSRRVERLLTVERFSHVMHLVSRVTGTLREGEDALGAYAASMNMGTLVGAPKVRAAELLREHEATKRGPYGGAIGYFTGEGELDTAVIIRSAVVREGTAYVRAGAGVVIDSIPLAEADETRRKAANVLEAVRAARRRGLSREGLSAGGGAEGGSREGLSASGGAEGLARDGLSQAGLSGVGGALSGEVERVREVVLVDNFDSFTFNLVEAFERLGCRVRVLRNTVSAESVVAQARARGALVVLSPGPGAPEDAGSCLGIVAAARGGVPVFGVCLGHQAIVLEAGGVVERAEGIVHGKASRLEHDGTGPFEGVPSPLFAGRYHSLATRRIPERLHVHAAIGDMAMAVSDRRARQVGLQFHPESILTPAGQKLLENVLRGAGQGGAS
ncbi:MAG: anthranilate synthase component 1 [Polyangiaceae bacterium]